MGQEQPAQSPGGTRPSDAPVRAPLISLPKGGGAIRGIGEKLSINPVTGTGSFQVPIATSAGRGGFGPRLALTYDSGAGNGPFGLGWRLELASITRKTDKGLPRYDDESDIYILAGAEDLVPVLRSDGTRFEDDTSAPGFVIHRYRPRTEGLFARIERWTSVATGEVHWRSITPDNVTTVYGRNNNSRIFDPADPAPAAPTRVFSWLICESYDDKGNAVVYDFQAENSAGVDRSQTHERNRTEDGRSVNRYLKSIRYGNQPSRLVHPSLDGMDWLFEMVFDYGEGHVQALPPGPEGQEVVALTADMPDTGWTVRKDPFSTYRAGFEVRTYRLCRRVFMIHRFPSELGVPEYLVSSTDLTYDEGPVASFLAQVVQSGYLRQADGTYLKRSLPPLELEYSKAELSTEVVSIDRASLEHLPAGLDGWRYQSVDLDGEGLSGVLTEQGTGWFYKRNVSPLPDPAGVAGGPAGARFSPVQMVGHQPSVAALVSGQQQFLDLAGDGQVDLVDFTAGLRGYQERTRDGWANFVAFSSVPNIDVDDANTRLIDLTGDGHADLMLTGDGILTWYPSLGEDGFGDARRVQQALDEEAGPRLVFADGAESIHLADLSGDGLTDLVRVRNGEVCYWPNLGYGRFGAKVTMDSAPWFDEPDLFEQRRVRLADIDGSGTTDILYLGRDGIMIWRNESGNRWSVPTRLPGLPRPDTLAAVAVLDLLGSGTACVVWSSPLPGETERMRYIDLMGGHKPHLLVCTRNNIGAETKIHYCPSTRFYLADQAAGRPWISRLPFPVHVVDRVETYDHVSRNRFVTRYAYHHGYFDGDEREFRGFGMVEQWDTEEFATLTTTGAPIAATNLDEATHVPPVLTRTWFHTGALLDGERISRQYEDEYYEPPAGSDVRLPDTVLPPGLSADEAREACRALKGSVLRREVFSLNGTPKESHPYTASEQNYTLRRLQERGENQHAVFLVHPRESIEFQYERNPTDPRVSHTLTLQVDEFGNVLKRAAVGYGRRQPDPGLPLPADRDKQARVLVTYTENDFTNAVTDQDDYRAPLLCESRTFQLHHVAPKPDSSGAASVFGFDGLAGLIEHASDGLHDLPYEDVDGTGVTSNEPFRRRIEHTRTVYRDNELTGLLPLGQLQSHALPGESYTFALTPELVDQVLAGPGIATAPELAALLGAKDVGGYVHSLGDAGWWIPSSRVFYSPDPGDSAPAELALAREHFFLPTRVQDPFGNSVTVSYDPYDLLPTRTTDALENSVTAAHDYRVLQPRLVIDPNGNRSRAAFDALGMVVATAVTDRTESLGDTLTGLVPDIGEATMLSHLAYPFADPHALLQGSTTRLVYDLHAFLRTKHDPQPQPAVVYTLARETHVADLAPSVPTRVMHSLSYSDGFGREIQRKVQAEPGPLQEGHPDVSPRWVGSGWTIFNNKGMPVRQYEPFFSATHRFEFAHLSGVSPVLFYDPLGRVVGTLHPNHTWQKVRFDPWRRVTWDVNDTVLVADPKLDADVGAYFTRLPDDNYLPTWHGQRIGGGLGVAEQDAAKKAAAHHATPAVVHLDSLGRSFLAIDDNGPAGKFATRTELDVEGNQRAVIDALGHVAMRYDYDMLGTVIHSASMEAGQRWTLQDVAGQPIIGWDSRGHRLRHTYDQLRRPAEVWLRKDADPELLVQRTVYGETKGESLNHRTRVFQVFDGAGVVTNEAYDFKGNLTRSSRRLAGEYKQVLDWSSGVILEQDVYAQFATFDALSRPVSLTTPDQSVIVPRHNEANLLDRVDVKLRGSITPTTFVADIDYNVRGQRSRIAYGNGTTTEYEYDATTFRLTRLHTRRGGEALQDLRYTYDPAGNIIAIKDAAQQAIFFGNSVVTADAGYTYDAIYRLIHATGREHIGQAGTPQTTWTDAFRTRLPHPNDGQAMRTYVEQYDYDPVGNILSMIHTAANGSWTRAYNYNESSLLDAAQRSNRLSRTVVGTAIEQYEHDGHGNMTRMPHLPLMQSDYLDRLVASSRQVVSDGSPETTYYVYDSAGQRVRKVTERAAADGATPSRKDERVYLGGFEVYREYDGAGATSLQRESLHIMDGQARVALVETRVLGTDGSPPQLIRYQLGNHLGSAALELDEQAQVISFEEYYPYGATSYQAGRSIAEVSLKRYRYTAKERDEETGLSYHGARYYAPWLARWTAVDPAGASDGTNLYRYVGCRPTACLDQSGQQGELWEERMAANGGVFQPLYASPVKSAGTEGLDQARRHAEFVQALPTKAKPRTTLDLVRSTPEKRQPLPRGAVTPWVPDLDKPTLGESLIPLWGSARLADYHLKGGDYGLTVLYMGMGALDAMSLGELALVTTSSKAVLSNAGRTFLGETVERSGLGEARAAVTGQASPGSASEAVLVEPRILHIPGPQEDLVAGALFEIKTSTGPIGSTTTLRGSGQNPVMGMSAATASGRSGDVWFHLRALWHEGPQAATNLAAASAGSNRVVMPFEKALARRQAAHGDVRTEVSAYGYAGTDVAEHFTYKAWFGDELVLDARLNALERWPDRADWSWWMRQ